ncbi:single-stranded-DNA-specific exonuclease RecJ [Turicibacter sanguinis]|uniref:single-stranded-DNA-specific exonuclease RecJ n=1 Tax=Turicibacter sanguinis TaxID=154288 RepID=UPI0018AB36F4|nr:single-stranded-DNA-specific exonuclease RecJ [Turicibacter sanguinis]MDB8552835.1 single-stranded-DNA-specific exonuclease RecJ [Turicibacter sanguinis]
MLKSNFLWQWSESIGELELGFNSNLRDEVKQLILNRHLASEKSIDTFLSGEGPLYDPFLFSDMKKSVDRINKAIENQEPILIYGDYDADGVTGTSILMRALRGLGAIVDYYIPNRFYEGYGPNEDAFMQAISDGYKLIITVDNGISGLLEADILPPYGVDLIITDHHQPKECHPNAFSIIHPELDSSYPFHQLSGAGVALKLAQALIGDGLSEEYFAIAALGTIGDVVPLSDENRYIVKRGLEAIRRSELCGLNALMNEAKIDKSEVDEVNVGFEICPRLNAPGRMDEAALAVELLISDDEMEAALIATQIESFNLERQKVTQKVLDQASTLMTPKQLEDKKVVLLYQPNWHEGILGIVAGRLSKLWQKAVFVLTDDHDGFVKGSARAVEGYHLFDLLNQNEDLIERFGGHALAAGITLAPENIQPLEDKLNADLRGIKIQPMQRVDLNLSLEKIDLGLVEDLAVLAPYGEGNRPPVIGIEQVKVKNIKAIGNKLQHLKFTIYDEAHQLDAIAFNKADLMIYLTPDTLFDFIGEIKINEWNGNRTVQFHVVDVKCDEFQLLDLRNKQVYEQNREKLIHATLYSEVTETSEISTLIIDKIPSSKEQLWALIKEHPIQNIVLAPLPNHVTFAPREKFITVYKLVKQHSPIHLNDQMYSYFMRIGISKNELLFILQVFFEIELVIIKNGSVFSTDYQMKRDLSEAPTYQSQQSKLLMLEFFELTTWSELKNSFINAREEITHES